MQDGSGAPEHPVTPQAGAVVHRGAGGSFEIVLVTANSGGWTIPKGLIDPGKTAMEMAAIEALEEAGVVCTPRGPAVGSYRYEKWGGLCVVEVFLATLDRELGRWAEDSTRERRWLPPSEAAALVKHDGLRTILEELAARAAAGSIG